MCKNVKVFVEMILKNISEFVSPIWENSNISDDLNIDLRVKRDDLIPFFGGGNKVRKMVPIITDAIGNGANAIVTTGGPNSNHLRVFALISAYLGWKCSVVIHSECPINVNNNINYQLIRMTGATIKECTLSNAPTEMDGEMARLEGDGFHPYYVWGGGHTPQGIRAYVDAVDELKVQLDGWSPDYIIVPSGTGGTHGGIHIGASEKYPNTTTFGISVARSKSRGLRKLDDTLNMYVSEYGAVQCKPFVFLDKYNAGGYERVNPDISATIKDCASRYGLILDPTYTGKAFTGMINLIREGFIGRGSKVLFWHTGGMMNLFPTSKLVS